MKEIDLGFMIDEHDDLCSNVGWGDSIGREEDWI